jgi:hypothetical protein
MYACIQKGNETHQPRLKMETARREQRTTQDMQDTKIEKKTGRN